MHVASKENLADILTKPLGLQQYIKLMTLLQLPLIKTSKHDGECQVEMNEIPANSWYGIWNFSTVIGINGWSTM